MMVQGLTVYPKSGRAVAAVQVQVAAVLAGLEVRTAQSKGPQTVSF